MNKDILLGKWQEIKGRVQERWCKLTNDDPGEIEGKCDRLLGLLRKQYGYIRQKTELEYKDGVQLAEIVSTIREVMTKKKNIMAIAYIARYGLPLLTRTQEGQITINIKEKKHGYHTDYYFNSRLGRGTAHLAPQ